jgi:DMSO/TMAO reductase YedYZ heme-binding membrane subunit
LCWPSASARLRYSPAQKLLNFFGSIYRNDVTRTKQLQRWNYLAFALAGAHALGYQINEKQQAPFIAAVVVSIAVTVALQAIGFQQRRTRTLSASKSRP